MYPKALKVIHSVAQGIWEAVTKGLQLKTRELTEHIKKCVFYVLKINAYG